MTFMALVCRGFGGAKVEVESFEEFTELARDCPLQEILQFVTAFL